MKIIWRESAGCEQLKMSAEIARFLSVADYRVLFRIIDKHIKRLVFESVSAFRILFGPPFSLPFRERSTIRAQVAPIPRDLREWKISDH
jgi:hypothetical protein